MTLITAAGFAQKKARLLVGTYTSGKSQGIYVFDFDLRSGNAKLLGSTYSSNPSFLAISAKGDRVYAVNEDREGMVTAFSFEPNSGKLTEINKVSAEGAHPCYISVDKTGKWLAVGNYSGGNLALYRINTDGSLNPAHQVIQHTGSSVDASRQEAPHVHATVFTRDNNFLLVPDLGTDKVMIYAFDDRKGALKPAEMPYLMVEPGAGPRHLDFDPEGRRMYLLEELTGTISAYEYRKGKLHLIQNTSSLAYDFSGKIGSADIHVSPDGRFLYASNRGESNDIAIFSINKEKGTLSLVGHQDALGRRPRNFNFDPSGNFLLVANQETDEVVVFSRNKDTGNLTDTGIRINVPAPVCIKWVDGD